MLGRGLVEPVDLAHAENPPTYPRLLQLLADELVASGFDLRHMLREIGLTQTYQRSIDFPEPLAVEQDYQNELAGLEAEQQRLNDLAKTSSEAVTEAVVALRAATADAAKCVAERNQAIAAVDAARKAQEQATVDLESAKAELAKQESIVTGVVEAATKTGEVAAQLPGDQALSQAAAALKVRSDEAQRVRQSAADALAARQTALDEAGKKVASAEQGLNACQQRLVDVDAKVVACCRTSDRQRRHHAHDRELARHAEGRLGKMRTLIEYSQLINRARNIRDQIAASEPDTTAGRQKLDQLTQELQEVTSKIDAARGKLVESWVEQARVAMLRPLSAEQFGWSVMQASGVIDETRTALGNEWDQQQAARKESQESAVQAAPAAAARDQYIESKLEEKLSPHVSQFASLFGGEPGGPQNDFHATVDQALFLSNGGAVRSWLEPREGNLTGRLLKIDQPQKVASELYLSVLTRYPTDDETRDLTAMLTAAGDNRGAVIMEAAWALTTSAEFRFNH
jgi:hypothetical protein